MRHRIAACRLRCLDIPTSRIWSGAGALTVLNPGSLSFPRQEGRRPSYMLMDLDDEGEAHFTTCYL